LEDFGVEKDRRERGRKTEEEDGDYCSSLLCCGFFGALVDEISLSLSLLGRCVLFLQLVIMQQVKFLLSHLIFKHRDGEYLLFGAGTIGIFELLVVKL
jgi:hypothetical protein